MEIFELLTDLCGTSIGKVLSVGITVLGVGFIFVSDNQLHLLFSIICFLAGIFWLIYLIRKELKGQRKQ